MAFANWIHGAPNIAVIWSKVIHCVKRTQKDEMEWVPKNKKSVENSLRNLTNPQSKCDNNIISYILHRSDRNTNQFSKHRQTNERIFAKLSIDKGGQKTYNQGILNQWNRMKLVQVLSVHADTKCSVKDSTCPSRHFSLDAE